MSKEEDEAYMMVCVKLRVGAQLLFELPDFAWFVCCVQERVGECLWGKGPAFDAPLGGLGLA